MVSCQKDLVPGELVTSAFHDVDVQCTWHHHDVGYALIAELLGSGTTF